MTLLSQTEIPGFVAANWTIDPVHSDVSVYAEIDLASFDTKSTQRDDHIRSKDFFDVDTYPTMTFPSTGITRTATLT